MTKGISKDPASLFVLLTIQKWLQEDCIVFQIFDVCSKKAFNITKVVSLIHSSNTYFKGIWHYI